MGMQAVIVLRGVSLEVMESEWMSALGVESRIDALLGAQRCIPYIRVHLVKSNLTIIIAVLQRSSLPYPYYDDNAILSLDPLVKQALSQLLQSGESPC